MWKLVRNPEYRFSHNGAQLQVSGIEMRTKMDDLLPIILDMLQDSSALQKREVCIALIMDFIRIVFFSVNVCFIDILTGLQ